MSQKEAFTENFATFDTVQGCLREVYVRAAARNLSEIELPSVNSKLQALGL